MAGAIDSAGDNFYFYLLPIHLLTVMIGVYPIALKRAGFLYNG